MKRLLVIIILMLLITGCGTKESTIKCHNNSNDDIRSSRIYMTGTFKKEKIETIKIDGTIKSDKEEALTEDRQFYDWFYGDMSKIDGIDYESNLDKDFKFNVLMDIDKIPNDSSFNKEELPTNEEEFIDYAKKLGYICEGK